MTQEEKQLLIQDLCGRLKSGLICSIYREDDEGFGWRDAKCKGYFQNNDNYEFYFEDVITIDNIERLKPYLRPLSSMTEEEFGFLQEHLLYDFTRIYSGKFDLINDIHIGNSISIDDTAFLLECLNKWHFDYRGLIPMGLALEAPKDMYN